MVNDLVAGCCRGDVDSQHSRAHAPAGRARIGHAVCAGALIVLALFWTAVKMDYREYVTGGTESQAIKVDIEDRLGYLGNRGVGSDAIDWNQAAYMLLICLISYPIGRYTIATAIFLPPVLCAELFEVWRRLDRSDLVHELVPLGPGEELVLPNRLVARPFRVPHRVPCQGYALWSRKIGRAHV